MCAMHLRVCCCLREVKVPPVTFVLSRYDGGMLTVCTVDLSVTDAAHCLGCVDRLLGGRSTTVVNSDTYTETHAQAI